MGLIVRQYAKDSELVISSRNKTLSHLCLNYEAKQSSIQSYNVDIQISLTFSQTCTVLNMMLYFLVFLYCITQCWIFYVMLLVVQVTVTFT